MVVVKIAVGVVSIINLATLHAAMGGKGSKSEIPEKRGEEAKKERESTSASLEAGSPSGPAELQRTGGQVQALEAAAPPPSSGDIDDMEKDYVETVVAKASEFGDNE